MAHRALGFYILFVLLFCCTAAHARPATKRVLLLNSYHQNLTWTDDIIRAVTDVLRPGEGGIELVVENMDTKRVEFSPEYKQQLHEVYAHKFGKMRPDLILASDNNAFEFLREYHDELFKDVPVVFCGVNDFRPEMLANHPLFTGVSEEIEALATVRIMLKLMPSTNQIYIVNDHTPTGQAWTRDIHQQLRALDDIEITYLPSMTLPALLRKLETLPADAAVLLGAYFRDIENNYLSGKESARRISQSSRVPVYGLLDFALGNGIVGGMLSSGYKQGQAMAHLGLLVLSGRRPSKLPVITSGLISPQFDYKELKRFGIGLTNLPPDSKIINRPRSFHEEHSHALYGIGAFLVVQTAVILFLVININRRRQAEASLRKIGEDLELRVRERTSELRESEKALRSVFDSTHDGIVVHTADGIILDANQGLLDMYGLQREALPSLSISRDISSSSNHLHQLSFMWNDVVKGREHTFEWIARRPADGEEFHVEIHMSPILFKKQRAILANIRDITERKIADNKLRQAISKLEAILENSLMGIAMTRGSVIETINKRGAETFGYAPEEMEHKDWYQVVSTPGDATNIGQEIRNTLGTTGEYLTERMLTGKEGHTSWCRMYAKAVDKNHLSKGIIWAWDDISDIKSAEDELRETRERALEASRAKSEFLAAMSHEIRTPMNAIVGMTEITLQTDLSDEQRDYLQTVKDSADHLLQIINDILDLSKIEAKKLELDSVDFDLPQHLRSTIKAMEVQAAQKGLNLTLEMTETVPGCIKGDPVCLRQILVNLVGNAIKFTHEGEVTVRVQAEPARPGAPSDELGVHFEIEDTGIGIPAEFIGSIFQNFSQTTRIYGGTGLGLAICKELIALMGGEIFVGSEVGVGSTFTFTAYFMPGEFCPVPIEKNAGENGRTGQGIHILLAEDNPVNVMVTALRLEEMGHTHEVAQNGEEVLSMLQGKPFDIILMDVEMPVMDGLAATRAIRNASPEMGIPDPNIPIIAMTAHALKEFRDKCLEAGMNAYISKPVDFEELGVIIERIRSGHEAPSILDTPDEAPSESLPSTEPAMPSAEASAVPETESPAPSPQPTQPPSPEPPRETTPLGLDEAMYADLVANGISEAFRQADMAKKSLSEGNREDAKRFVHTISNICKVIGATDCRAMSTQAEAACRIAPDEEIGSRLDKLLQTLRNLAPSSYNV